MRQTTERDLTMVKHGQHHCQNMFDHDLKTMVEHVFIMINHVLTINISTGRLLVKNIFLYFDLCDSVIALWKY